jgi:hypothetical protein
MNQDGRAASPLPAVVAGRNRSFNISSQTSITTDSFHPVHPLNPVKIQIPSPQCHVKEFIIFGKILCAPFFYAVNFLFFFSASLRDTFAFLRSLLSAIKLDATSRCLRVSA